MAQGSQHDARAKKDSHNNRSLLGHMLAADDMNLREERDDCPASDSAEELVEVVAFGHGRKESECKSVEREVESGVQTRTEREGERWHKAESWAWSEESVTALLKSSAGSVSRPWPLGVRTRSLLWKAHRVCITSPT